MSDEIYDDDREDLSTDPDDTGNDFGVENDGRINYRKTPFPWFGGKGHQQKRERLWASPHCLPIDNGRPKHATRSLFGDD